LTSTHSGGFNPRHVFSPAGVVISPTGDGGSWTKSTKPATYDALVLPGGVANPDRLRTESTAVAFVKAIASAGKPIAVICHGPWTLVEADVVRGRTLTSWPSLKTDITNAGANWVDEEVHIDRNGPGVIVSSRKPDDLKAFCQELVDEFAAA
jgi:protease I